MNPTVVEKLSEARRIGTTEARVAPQGATTSQVDVPQTTAMVKDAPVGEPLAHAQAHPRFVRMSSNLPYTRFDNEGPPVASGGQLLHCKTVLVPVALAFTSLVLVSSSRVEAMPQLRDEVALFHAADNATHSLDSAQPSAICSQLPDMACGEWTVTIGTLVGIVTGPILVPVFFAALCCCGFGTAGVVAGSCAAGCQLPVTAAGGCFATLQSCGALGCWGASAAAPPLLILSVLLAVAGGFIGMGVTGVCACDWKLAFPTAPHVSFPSPQFPLPD